MSDTTKFSEFAAGINSPHNACTFRADCRKADAEIARLRENVAPVISSRASAGAAPILSEQTRRCEWCGEIAQGECGCAAETEIARLREDAGINSIHNACAFRENCRQAEAEIARLRDLCQRASSWVEDVRTDGNEATRQKRNFVEELQIAARKDTK
jgi:hypothetical protein